MWLRETYVPCLPQASLSAVSISLFFAVPSTKIHILLFNHVDYFENIPVLGATYQLLMQTLFIYTFQYF